MKAKLLLIFLILLSFSVIGCVDDTEEPMNDSNMTNESVEDIVNETVPDDIITNETVEDEELSEEEEDKPLDVVETTNPRTYTIYMKNFHTQPSNLTINRGDTVAWFNDNEPTRIFTLVSNEGLWENENIVKRKSFKYTFNESGTYTYEVLTWEQMKGTIIVK
ncbi:MAG: cupredoxin domain-containing protein [Methanolobus sp.]|jgi:plastocyanin|nr:cupredoxin domain-containing protein [Methanolobus sp.]